MLSGNPDNTCVSDLLADGAASLRQPLALTALAPRKTVFGLDMESDVNLSRGAMSPFSLVSQTTNLKVFSFDMLQPPDLLGRNSKVASPLRDTNVRELLTTCDYKPRSKAKKSVIGFFPGRGYFDPLIKALNDYFSTQSESFDATLEVFHLKLALTLFRRKFCVRDYELPNTSAELVAQINALLAKNKNFSQKRTEENNKFVFKHAIKLMKQTTKKANGSQLSTDQAEVAFRDAYGFREDEAKALNETSISSLSLTNVRLIFKNKRFREDFFRLVGDPTITESPFFSSYMGGIGKKLTKLFRKWSKEISSSSPNCEQTAKILLYFQNNNQCKLPWTRSEILKAVECLTKTVCDGEQSPLPISMNP